jgi:hypothetical protein
MPHDCTGALYMGRRVGYRCWQVYQTLRPPGWPEKFGKKSFGEFTSVENAFDYFLAK